MVKTLYTLIYYILSPLMCVRWFFKSLKPPQYREPFRQRFGFVAKHEQTDIWFHAVSMGETSGAISIIKKLLAANPQLKIVVTTTTPTGAKLLQQNLGDKVTHYYSPCDLPGTIKRFIKRVKPRLVVIMETELWPNWLAHINQQKIPLFLVNARLSESSARKYLWFPETSKQIFSQITQVLAVNKADAQRFERIGVEKNSIQITGNIKFDADFEVANPDQYYPHWSNKFVWIAASTHQGEDEKVLSAHKKLLETMPDAKLILVPRHPERFTSVSDLIVKENLHLATRSKPDSWSEDAQVLLGDTMGELLLAYQKSDVAFIAGSFADIGGHNAIEAAFYAKPVLTGPIYHNFQYLFDALCEQEASQVVHDSNELAKKLLEFSQNPSDAKAMGERGKKFVEKNKGALEQVVNQIQSAL